jgi:hypothetical protein
MGGNPGVFGVRWGGIHVATASSNGRGGWMSGKKQTTIETTETIQNEILFSINTIPASFFQRWA